MSLDRAIDAIKKYEKFLIISHIGLEGDSIGCQLAFEKLLKGMGKKAAIVNGGELPSQYDFMGIATRISTNMDEELDYEVVVVLDCPVIRRVGEAKKFLERAKIVINIDHHVSNEKFGDINWVEGSVSSCGEMIYRLYKEIGADMDRECAFYLYIAILTDTGSFAYENTSSDTHAIASDLVSKGLNPRIVHQSLYENKTLPEIELLRDTLSTLKVVHGGTVAYMYVNKKMLSKYKLDRSVTEGFINYARSITSVKVAVIFFEDPLELNTVPISFRAKGEVNVDKIAAVFGGGGHKNASGCVIKGSIKPTMKKVLAKIKEYV
ncbi:MAG: bifunctional oligoribonuclease/PAP phosphatase NrnA [Candidatus Omnitrophota bacterium]